MQEEVEEVKKPLSISRRSFYEKCVSNSRDTIVQIKEVPGEI